MGKKHKDFNPHYDKYIVNNQSARYKSFSGELHTNPTQKNGTFYGEAEWAKNLVTRSNDPNYRIKIARRQDAGGAYSKVVHGVQNDSMYSASKYKPDPRSTSRAWTGTVYSSPVLVIPSNSLTASADDVALKRMKKRLANDRDAFNALVPLAELRETFKLHNQVIDATKGMLHALIDLKRGKVRNIVSAASKTWLTYSFGIAPTIGDLNAAWSSINSYIDRTDITQRYKGRQTVEWMSQPKPKALAQNTACSGYSYDVSAVRAQHSYQVQYSCGVHMDLRSSNNYNVPAHFGLQFQELIPTFWELVPFSWVVDYFTTTGEFLEDVFSSNAGDTIYCCKSVKYYCKQEADWSLRNVSSAWTLTDFDKATHTEKCFSMHTNRTLLAALPHRAYRFKTVNEIGTNSVNRLLNLASVLLSGGNRGHF